MRSRSWRNIGLVLTLLIAGCTQVEVTRKEISLPLWLHDVVARAEDGSAPVAGIVRFQYHGETVYSVNPGCCDRPNRLYDSEGAFITNIGGMGVIPNEEERALMREFSAMSTDPRLIWSDLRARVEQDQVLAPSSVTDVYLAKGQTAMSKFDLVVVAQLTACGGPGGYLIKVDGATVSVLVFDRVPSNGSVGCSGSDNAVETIVHLAAGLDPETIGKLYVNGIPTEVPTAVRPRASQTAAPAATATPIPSTSIPHATGPGNVLVLMMQSGGGLMPLRLAGLPEFVLYGDGTLIQRGSDDRLLRSRLSETAIQLVLRRAVEAAGLLNAKHHYDAPAAWAHAANTRLVLHVDAGCVSTSFYPPDMYSREDLRAIDPADRGQIRRLAALERWLNSLDEDLVGSDNWSLVGEYLPETIDLIASAPQPSELSTVSADARPWPFEGIDIRSWRQTLHGDVAGEVYRFLFDNGSYFSQGGYVASVNYFVRIPEESAPRACSQGSP